MMCVFEYACPWCVSTTLGMKGMIYQIYSIADWPDGVVWVTAPFAAQKPLC